MSAAINELRANNTSGVPGLRLNVRRGYRVIDVAWFSGKKCSTSYPVNQHPLKAVERAMQRRVAEVGAVYELTPRQAWERLKRAQEARS